MLLLFATQNPKIFSMFAAAAAEEKLSQQLLNAAYKGNEDEVVALLAAGANPNPSDRNKGSPLYYAAWEGHTGVVRLLIENGANLEVRDFDGYTPLHLAAVRRYTVIVKLLLAMGANPRAKSKNNHTPDQMTHNNEIKKLIQNAKKNSVPPLKILCARAAIINGTPFNKELYLLEEELCLPADIKELIRPFKQL